MPASASPAQPDRIEVSLEVVPLARTSREQLDYATRNLRDELRQLGNVKAEIGGETAAPAGAKSIEGVNEATFVAVSLAVPAVSVLLTFLKDWIVSQRDKTIKIKLPSGEEVEFPRTIDESELGRMIQMVRQAFNDRS
jgi:hypothetical protein